jgi:hypothetical protein
MSVLLGMRKQFKIGGGNYGATFSMAAAVTIPTTNVVIEFPTFLGHTLNAVWTVFYDAGTSTISLIDSPTFRCELVSLQSQYRWIPK